MDTSRPRRRPRSVPPALIWVGGILMLLAVADCVRCLPALFEARQQAGGLSGEVAELGRATERLRKDVRRLKEDPKAVEEVARRELGLMRPGEIVFIIVDTPEKKVDSRQSH